MNQLDVIVEQMLVFERFLAKLADLVVGWVHLNVSDFMQAQRFGSLQELTALLADEFLLFPVK